MRLRHIDRIARLCLVATLITSCGGNPADLATTPSPIPAPIPAPPVSVPLTGVVTSASGQPLPGARVSVAPPNFPSPFGAGTFATDADANGTYRFAYLMPGTYTIRADASGYQQKQMTVDVFKETSVNLALLPIAYVSMTGTVTNAASGAPVAGAYIDILGGVRTAVPFTYTDANGQFRFDQILIGDTTFRIRAVGYNEQRATVFIDGTTRASVAIEPLPVTTLSGIVTNANTGAPVRNAAVQVIQSSGGIGHPTRQPSVTTDANGAYRFPAVFASNTIIAVVAQGYAEARAGVSISADGSSTLNFALTPFP